MISFFFDLFSFLARSFFAVLKFLSKAFFAVLSFLSSLLIAPLKALLHFLHRSFGLPMQWTSLYLAGFLIIVLLVVLLGLWAFAAGRTKRGSEQGLQRGAMQSLWRRRKK